MIQEWNEIFDSSISSRAYKIGIDLFSSPQILGFLLHELILLELARWYPEIWRRDQNTTEKDLVYILDNNFSIEIKIYSSIPTLMVIAVTLKQAQLEERVKRAN